MIEPENVTQKRNRRKKIFYNGDEILRESGCPHVTGKKKKEKHHQVLQSP